MNSELSGTVNFLGFEMSQSFYHKLLTVIPLDISAYFYLGACLMFFVAVSRSGLKKQSGENSSRSLSISVFLSYAGFVLHTAGLLGRWYEGGFGRPPWTNLYESLVSFAWMLSLFQLIALKKYKVPLVGAISNPLIFLLMGMSVMTPNKGLEPLIPALQSHWLKIHVVFGMIAYAGFTMAACFSFFHLIKAKVSLSKIGAGLALVSVMNLGIIGGNEYFDTGKFYLAKTIKRVLPTGESVWVKDNVQEYPGGPIVTHMELVPDSHYFLSAAIFFFLLASAGLFVFRRSKQENSLPQDIRRRSFLGFILGFLMMLIFFVHVNYRMALNETLRWQSNPYLLMLLFMTLFVCALFIVIVWRYEKFMSVLPSAERLDELSYKNILFAFPFQSLLLVTGAIWAYSAWGRSWGWDPKETWALITWFAYLIYLHGKLLLRWKPTVLSVIALVSFVILVFSFLGVNLVLSGLHSYGAA